MAKVAASFRLNERMFQRLYSYAEVRNLHLEPSAKCQAACPMCGRNVAGGRPRANLPLNEVTLAEFVAWFSPAFLRQLSTLTFCGNFGDPIIAQDCLPMLEHARRMNRRLHLNLITNGSARPASFWSDLGALGAHAHFALDGATEETHRRYRRHTRFGTILQNAATFMGAGGRATWDMLVFSHNEHEVETARTMARQMGFERFVLKSTTRFNGPDHRVLDDDGREVDRLHPSERFPAPALAARPDRQALASCPIRCKVIPEGSVYVAATGHVFPCCWLGAILHEKPGLPDSRKSSAVHQSFHELVGRIGEDRLNLRETPLAVIVERYLPHFTRAWGPGPERLMKCAQICGQVGIDAFTSTYLSTDQFRPSGNPAA